MQKLKPLLYIAVMFNMVAVLYLLLRPSGTEMAYFKNAEVYNSFDYKIELENEITQFQSKAQSELDSLEQDYNLAVSYLNGADPTNDQIMMLQRKQKMYFSKKEESERQYNEKVAEYYDLIWARINAYTMEFGEENGYQYIFGANGDGSVMYAEESTDVTEEMIAYVNSRYAGE